MNLTEKHKEIEALGNRYYEQVEQLTAELDKDIKDNWTHWEQKCYIDGKLCVARVNVYLWYSIHLVFYNIDSEGNIILDQTQRVTDKTVIEWIGQPYRFNRDVSGSVLTTHQPI